MPPAENGPVLAMCASPGVVINPAKRACTRWLANPPATNSAIHAPDSRVSIPMTTSEGPCLSRTQIASAWPTQYTVYGSSGYLPATPRIPSVPKNLRILVWLLSYFFDRQLHGNDRG